MTGIWINIGSLESKDISYRVLLSHVGIVLVCLKAIVCNHLELPGLE